MRILSILIIALSLVSFVVAEAAKENPVLRFSFDEGSGDKTKDRTKNGHVGILINNPKWVEGKFKQALSFDGKGAKVEVERSDTIELKKEITFATWAILKNNTGNHEIVRKQIPNGKGYDMRIQNGILHWWVNVGGWNNANYQKLLSVDEWMFLTGTYDGKKLLIYVNGKEVASNNVTGEILYDESNLLIGSGAPHDPNYNLNGALDEFMLFPKALSEEEIKKVMESPYLIIPKSKTSITWGHIKTLSAMKRFIAIRKQTGK